ncbi:hypothetical protein FACS189425_04290 [Clostridia bacterium]|nr:hypothetical protein FACS189425_04290 [Clostridia bacterium]
MKKRRKWLALILSAVILFVGMSPLAEASTTASIQPMFINLSSISASMSANGNILNVGVDISGISGTTNISLTTTLQRRPSGGSFSDVTSWNDSTNSSSLLATHSYYATSGYYYRIKVAAKVTRNGIVENVTTNSNECYI